MKRSTSALVAVLVVATFVAFSPILSAGFTNWDDPVMVTQNASITGLSWPHLVTFFTTFTEKHYHPLVLISYAADYQLFGLDPLAFHLTNLALHLGSTVLVFWLCLVLTQNVRVGLVTAALFGWHPMHVESVAWISERKDVLYGCLFWAALLGHAYYVRRRRRSFYWLCLGLFVLSLLSKSMAVTLPAVLLLIDWLLGRKIDRSAILEKLPHFALSLAMTVVTMVGHHEPGVKGRELSFSLLGNIQSASENLMFYLVKFVAPVRLAALYPVPRELGDAPAWVFVWSPLLLVVLGAAAYRFARPSKPAIFGVLFFVVTFLPVSQLLPMGPTIPADRYTYVPYVGLFFALASLADSFRAKERIAGRRLLLDAILVLIVAASWLAAFQRVKVWHDSAALWEDSVAKYRVPKAYHNLGLEYWTAKRDAGTALALFSKAIEGDPLLAAAWLDRGVVYAHQGDYVQSISNLNEAERLDPKLADVYVNRGNSFAAIGMPGRAIKDYTTALRLRPAYAEGWYNRGNVYLAAHQWGRAIADFTEALKYGDSFAVRTNRGNAYWSAGKLSKAFDDYTMAIQLEPRSPNAYYSRAKIYAKNGQPAAARTDALTARSLGMTISDSALAELSAPPTNPSPGPRPTVVR